MSTHGNIHDFVSKIDWEGGIYGALEYGLTPSGYDLPQNVVDAWWEIREVYESMEPLIEDFWRLSDIAIDQTPFEEE